MSAKGVYILFLKNFVEQQLGEVLRRIVSEIVNRFARDRQRRHEKPEDQETEPTAIGCFRIVQTRHESARCARSSLDLHRQNVEDEESVGTVAEMREDAIQRGHILQCVDVFLE